LWHSELASAKLVVICAAVVRSAKVN